MASHRDDIGLKHKKVQFSEWFSEIIAKTELADLRYNVKGFLVHKPWSVRAMKAMFRLYEKELERKGHEPVWFPVVIPEENFKLESSHVEGFTPEVFWITGHGSDEKDSQKLALRPTSETAIYKMYSLWIRSHRDLPIKYYQTGQVWRCETKATRPFIRGREFHWIEAHDVFATEEGAHKQTEEDVDTTEQVMHKEFGIPFIPFKRPAWDTFPGAVYTIAADSLMPDGRTIQQPSTHFLGQNFTRPFNVQFSDENENTQYPWGTCYGPAIWRMLASVIAIHGDDVGLQFPFGIAPVQIVIVPIYQENNKKSVLKKAQHIKESLKEYRVKIDDSDQKPGWKFNQWEMKGVPLRIEVGPKDVAAGSYVVVRRDTKEKTKVKESALPKTISTIGPEITTHLVKKADSWFAKQIHSAKSLAEIGHQLEKGGFVKIDFCSTEKEGEKCAEKIKEKYHAEVRGTRTDKKEKPSSGKCVVCKKKAQVVVYVAKQY